MLLLKQNLPTSILAEIATRKVDDVARRGAARHRGRAEPSTRPLRLDEQGFHLIAEIKRRSPSRGPLRPGLDPGEIAAIYDRHATAISVLADGPYFDGSLADVAAARARTRLPVLAKDFVVDLDQIPEARAHGADVVLLIASLLDAEAIERGLAEARALGMSAIVEVHDEDELSLVLAGTSAEIVGVNTRDLKTMTIHKERVHELAPRIRAAGRKVVAESGLESPADLARLRGVADAVLIGTSLMLAPNIEEKIEELGW